MHKSMHCGFFVMALFLLILPGGNKSDILKRNLLHLKTQATNE